MLTTKWRLLVAGSLYAALSALILVWQVSDYAAFGAALITILVDLTLE